jgi:hypothetical protein
MALNLTGRVANVSDERSDDVALFEGGVATLCRCMQPTTRLFVVTKATTCFAMSLGRISAGADEIRRSHGEMTLELDVHLVGDAPPSAEHQVDEPSVPTRLGHTPGRASERIAVTD